MRAYFSKFLFFPLLILLYGCNQTDNKFQERFDVLGLALDETRRVIIIPNEGCGGCISGATSFVKDNEYALLENRVKVVFTGVKDSKLFRNQVGTEFLTSDLVTLDSSNLFMHKDVVSIYPRLISMESGRVKKIEEFDPTASELLINSLIQ